MLSLPDNWQFSISIHAPREGSDATEEVNARIFEISIHAPREGSDQPFQQPAQQVMPISIHAPREGSDSLINAGGLVRQNFYPRSPRGERQGCF